MVAGGWLPQWVPRYDRWAGVAVSAAFHGALVAFVALGAAPDPLDPLEEEIVVVAIVGLPGATSAAKPAETPPAAKPAAAAVKRAPDAVPPAPDAVPLPGAAPARARQRPLRRPSRFDPDKVAALLDKTPRARRSDPPPPPPEAAPPSPSLSPLGQASRFSASDALKAQISPHWNFPAGAAWAERLVVEVDLELSLDGALAAPPEVRVRGVSGPFAEVAKDSARRAVQKSLPLRMPPETYAKWRQTRLIFDPSRMLGG